MTVTIKGEGNQQYPVLSRSRWGVLTLGCPNGGVRDVDESRCVEVVESLPAQP